LGAVSRTGKTLAKRRGAKEGREPSQISKMNTRDRRMGLPRKNVGRGYARVRHETKKRGIQRRGEWEKGKVTRGEKKYNAQSRRTERKKGREKKR